MVSNAGLGKVTSVLIPIALLVFLATIKANNKHIPVVRDCVTNVDAGYLSGVAGFDLSSGRN